MIQIKDLEFSAEEKELKITFCWDDESIGAFQRYLAESLKGYHDDVIMPGFLSFFVKLMKDVTGGMKKEDENVSKNSSE